ncbi:MAG: carbamoyltransferase HypF, partial [FCB group bacterium]|nr:carbamoyltransferase HypF [FCB group bacterium]
MPPPDPDRTRLHLDIHGIVQGVGFRPFIYNLAQTYGLTGWVSNTASGVVLEVEGAPESIAEFRRAITTEAPPLSLIESVQASEVAATGAIDFVIRPSDRGAAVQTMISSDAAVCPDCLRELFDPDDRRYRYAFINCTNCGPRYTIIRSIPYDRPFTTMVDFTMCPACQAEYNDPRNRRFHAQPNACPDCGPRLELWDSEGKSIAGDYPVTTATDLLRNGQIVALKGLGGFHLAVDASNEKAVRELRQRKGRDEKPFALMARNTEAIKNHCWLTEEEERLLTSPRAPIVLLRRKVNDSVAPSIAPGNDRLGFMLPYTPLHHLIMAEGPETLVMTSANLSEEPICIDNQEALTRLQGIADAFLVHNRDIYLRSDDSVWIFLADRARPIRRSRGFVPQPVFVEGTGPPILAVGAELKNTVCLLKGNQAIVSQHIGDLKNLEALNFFKQTIHHLETIFQTQPETIVTDLHPGYLSSQWAETAREVPVFKIQHHHAHLAALLAEHRQSGPVIGVILDGTGLGTNGRIWGGEVLVGTIDHVERRGHLEAMPLPGGDAAILHPWRTAVAYLEKTCGPDFPALPFMENLEVDLIREMVQKQVNTPLTTSCGRLFDAVAALTGGCASIRYEAQAAIELMQIAAPVDRSVYATEIQEKDDVYILSVQSLIENIIRDLRAGIPEAEISGRFHRFILDGFLNLVENISRQTGIKTVGFSGGVFQNQLLLETMIPEFERH